MSLIPTSWRGRRQVPATPIPAAERDMTEAEAVTASLKVMCEHRFQNALIHVDRRITAWSHHRGVKVEVSVLLDELLDMRDQLAKTRVKA